MWSLSKAIGRRWRREEHSYEFFFLKLKPVLFPLVCRAPNKWGVFLASLVKVAIYYVYVVVDYICTLTEGRIFGNAPRVD